MVDDKLRTVLSANLAPDIRDLLMDRATTPDEQVVLLIAQQTRSLMAIAGCAMRIAQHVAPAKRQATQEGTHG